jgi:hypothetical protein
LNSVVVKERKAAKFCANPVTATILLNREEEGFPKISKAILPMDEAMLIRQQFQSKRNFHPKVKTCFHLACDKLEYFPFLEA